MTINQRPVNSDMSLGKVTVKKQTVTDGDGTGGVSSVAGLTDVVMNAPQDGDVIKFLGGKWVNSPVTSVVQEVIPPPAQNFITHVNVSTTVPPVDGSSLIYNAAAGEWVPSVAPVVTETAIPQEAQNFVTNVQLADGVVPTDGASLVYDSVSGKWIPTVAAVVTETTIPQEAQNFVTNVTVADGFTPIDGASLVYNATLGKWVPSDASVVVSSNAQQFLATVAVTSNPTPGSTITFNATTGKWEATPVSAGLKSSPTDTTFGYLNQKIIAGTNISITEVDLGAGNTALRIASSGGGSVGLNVPPELLPVPQQTPTQHQSYVLNLVNFVMQTDSDPILSYTMVSGTLPVGITMNATTGVLSGTPTALGTTTATFVCADKDGNSNTQTVRFTVGVTAIVDYDYGTFDSPNPLATDVDFGTFDSPTNQGSIDFGLI